MNNISNLITTLDYQIRSKTKMKPFNQNPEDIARTFTQYVRAIVQILIWATIGLASLATACIALSGILVSVKFVLKIIFYGD